MGCFIEIVLDDVKCQSLDLKVISEMITIFDSDVDI